METNKNIHGFKTPPDYFESIEDRVFDSIRAEALPKNTGFKVPSGYFEQLDTVLVERVIVKEKETKVISIFSRYRLGYVAAIAACAILLFSIFNDKQAETISNLDVALIESYIEEGSLDMDTYDVLALFDNEGIENLSLDNNLIDQDNLEDYLLESLDESAFTIE